MISTNMKVDMSMVSKDFDFQNYLLDLANEEAVPMSRINE